MGFLLSLTLESLAIHVLTFVWPCMDIVFIWNTFSYPWTTKQPMDRLQSIQFCKSELYNLSNLIKMDAKYTSFHQYLRYYHKTHTTVLSTPSAIIKRLILHHWSCFPKVDLLKHIIQSWDGRHCIPAVHTLTRTMIMLKQANFLNLTLAQWH